MSEEQNFQPEQRIQTLERELAEVRKELGKKEDRPNQFRKYMTWLIIGFAVIAFYGTYYFYVMSLF